MKGRRSGEGGSLVAPVWVRISADYWRVRDWRCNRTTNKRIAWTCTLRLRCQQLGSHAVSVRVWISGDYWRVRDWRRDRTTEIRITWTRTLRLRLRLQCGCHAVSGDYWWECHWRRNRTTKLTMQINWTCTLRMKSILQVFQRFMTEETF